MKFTQNSGSVWVLQHTRFENTFSMSVTSPTVVSDFIAGDPQNAESTCVLEDVHIESQDF